MRDTDTMTTDHYNYVPSQAFNMSTFPIGRFANEFGYHSMPSLQTWQQAVSPADLHFNSTVVTLRDHHPPAGGTNTSNTHNASIGQGQMTLSAQTWYPVPNLTTTTVTTSLANFAAWCHTTQIFQADFYRAQIAFYRRGSARRERQLGSLYWQLEDQWQAPTWSGIEYDGRWKVLHYVARDAYEPLVVFPFHNASTQALEVWAISDLWTEVDVDVTLTWYDWGGARLDDINDADDGNENGEKGKKSVTIGAINGTKVLDANLTTLLGAHDPKDTLLEMHVAAHATPPNANTTRAFSHTSWFHAAPLSRARIPEPGLTLAHDNVTRKFTVRATKGVAAWVWLEYPATAGTGGEVVGFERNAFWLGKGEEVEVGYEVMGGAGGDGGRDGEWVGGVTVRSLWDNYSL